MTTALAVLAALTLNAAQPEAPSPPPAPPPASERTETVRHARAAHENVVEVARLEADAQCSNRRYLTVSRLQSTPRLQSVNVALITAAPVPPLTVARPRLPRPPTRIASLALHIE